ncbi:unnamed protein product, partial [Laminaria digitata]
AVTTGGAADATGGTVDATAATASAAVAAGSLRGEEGSGVGLAAAHRDRAEEEEEEEEEEGRSEGDNLLLPGGVSDVRPITIAGDGAAPSSSDHEPNNDGELDDGRDVYGSVTEALSPTEAL